MLRSRGLIGLFASALTLLTAACESSPDQGAETDDALARGSGLTLAQVTGAGSLMPRTLSLTYDDGPDTGTIALAEYLAEEGIPATFFINGCHVVGSPAPVEGAECLAAGTIEPVVLERLTKLGHRVANHTEDHLALNGMSADAFLYQVEGNQATVDRFVHDGAYFFRPPANYWDSSLASFARSRPALRKLLGPIARDVDGADWGCAQEGLTPEACAERYVQSLDAVPSRNGIVQMHDGNAYAHGTDYALRLTRAFIATLRGRPEPYRFVALDAIRGVRGELAFTEVGDWSHAFADDAGWAASASRYASLQLADVDADGKADLCGRDSGGIVCARSTGNAFREPARFLDVDFTDAGGWSNARHGTTIRLADVDGDGAADVCGHAVRGVVCYFSSRDRFQPNGIVADAFAGDDFGAVRFGDVDGDGKADVCGRRSDGVFCALSRGRSEFAPLTSWVTSDFTDDKGWSPAKHDSTLQLADVNGDGRDDLCGRATAGIVCALSSARGFAAPVVWTRMFADAAGWDAPARFGTIRFADIDGDGRADVCGRDAHGIVCGVSDGTSFGAFRFVSNDDFRDDGGWSADASGMTIQLGDVNGDGRADVCGRGTHRVACARAANPETR